MRASWALAALAVGCAPLSHLLGGEGGDGASLADGADGLLSLVQWGATAAGIPAVGLAAGALRKVAKASHEPSRAAGDVRALGDALRALERAFDRALQKLDGHAEAITEVRGRVRDLELLLMNARPALAGVLLSLFLVACSSTPPPSPTPGGALGSLSEAQLVYVVDVASQRATEAARRGVEDEVCRQVDARAKELAESIVAGLREAREIVEDELTGGSWVWTVAPWALVALGALWKGRGLLRRLLDRLRRKE